jgi:hypothetical protein
MTNSKGTNDEKNDQNPKEKYSAECWALSAERGFFTTEVTENTEWEGEARKCAEVGWT